MNTERILQVAAEIEAMPHAVVREDPDLEFDLEFENAGFNMLMWNDAEPCGTVCCIGGHIAPTGGDRLKQVADQLGLTLDTADLLCYPILPTDDWGRITPAQAARVLRHLAETGKVDWSIIKASAP